jgi:hypothetical protein
VTSAAVCAVSTKDQYRLVMGVSAEKPRRLAGSTKDHARINITAELPT